MKPTPQISSQQSDRKRFPLTDYHYQSTLEASHADVKETRGAHPQRAIWKLNAEFFAAEARVFYVIELAFFSLIAGLSAWPIVSMLVAVTRMVRNY
jgi:hypothetical protein